MADTEQKYQVIEYEGRPARLYPDGSIRNERGHMLAPLPGTQPITHENAREMLHRRIERRRQIMREAANEAVQRDDFRLKYGDSAFLAEMAYNAQIKATTPDDSKMIEAARWLTQMTGESDDGSDSSDNVPLSELRGFVRDIAEAARAVAAAQQAQEAADE